MADPLYATAPAIVTEWAGPTTDRRLRDTVREAGRMMGPDTPEGIRVSPAELEALVTARDAADRVRELLADATKGWATFLPDGLLVDDEWSPGDAPTWRALEECTRSVLAAATGGRWTASVSWGWSRGPRLTVHLT